MDNKIILEFNEEGQNFHYNHIVDGKPQSPVGTNGYEKLLLCRNCEEADLFADFLVYQYTKLDQKITFYNAKHTINNLTEFIFNYTQKII